MISKTSEAYGQIKKNLDLLLNGTILVIDPSMGSASSLPGWAVYKQTDLLNSGVMEVPRAGDHPIRLAQVRSHMTGLLAYYRPDLVVIENIPAAAGRFNLVALASLHMARGAILSCVGEMPWVTILPQQWTKLVRETYQKGDKQDAVEIGYVVLELAKRISQSDPPKKYGEPLKQRTRRKVIQSGRPGKKIPVHSRRRVNRTVSIKRKRVGS